MSDSSSATPLPRVVILGGGFAGIETARVLRRVKADVLLIDRQNYHGFQPLLYQVATASLSPADIAWPIRHVLAGQANLRVAMAEVTDIDRTAQTVIANGRKVPFDYLIVATGAAHSYFGHQEWQRFAPGLKDLDDAVAIRRRILLAFEKAELSTDESERQRLLTFVIVGGGPTGVELAGAIAELARQTLPHEYSVARPETARVVLIEGMQSLLPNLAKKAGAYAQKRLAAMGVEVRLGSKVTACTSDGVELDTERIESGTTLWAAGVRASSASDWLKAETDDVGRVIVESDLCLPRDPKVFVVGDTAHVTDRNGKLVPGLAASAKQMGRFAGKTIAHRLAGNLERRAFRYRHLGDLATVGRRAAVCDFGPVMLTGFPAWLVWSVAHIYFLIGLKNRLAVAISWLWQYATFQRGARII